MPYQINQQTGQKQYAPETGGATAGAPTQTGGLGGAPAQAGSLGGGGGGEAQLYNLLRSIGLQNFGSARGGRQLTQAQFFKPQGRRPPHPAGLCNRRAWDEQPH